MSKDNPKKQKDIDDVLMSIDSLLDTATDVELSETKESPANPTRKITATTSAGKSSASSKKPLKSKHKLKIPVKSEQNISAQARKKPQPGNNLTIKPGAEDAQTTTAKSNARVDKPVREALTTSTKAADKIDENPADKRKMEIAEDQSSSSEENQDHSTNSLNFTPVDDDLSQAMRELPVLVDIVTTEDLALIGSGKEPPKKILTEAFKRLSLTDKLIKILENQLSDYDISKLEYKYLHELFDELLEKENKNK